MPWPARSDRRRCTSALVPTSMPRVGSSMISSRGSVASHLAMTTFCWLPPLIVVAAMSRAPVFTWSRAAHGPLVRVSAPAVRTPAVLRPRRITDATLRATEPWMTSPCLRRSSGTKAMPARTAARGSCRLTGLPASRTEPASYASTPKTARAISLRPAPTSPARPTISPARTSKLTSWKTPPRSRPSTWRTTSPTGATVFGNRSPTSRPTILATSCSTDVSAIASVATYSPSRITVTVSQSAKTSSNRCEMNTRPRPSSRSPRATWNSRSTSTPLRAAVGSSMIRRVASSDIALAISMICWSAMERPRASRRGSRSTPSRWNSAVASAYIAGRSIRRAPRSG